MAVGNGGRVNEKLTGAGCAVLVDVKFTENGDNCRGGEDSEQKSLKTGV